MVGAARWRSQKIKGGSRASSDVRFYSSCCANVGGKPSTTSADAKGCEESRSASSRAPRSPAPKTTNTCVVASGPYRPRAVLPGDLCRGLLAGFELLLQAARASAATVLQILQYNRRFLTL